MPLSLQKHQLKGNCFRVISVSRAFFDKFKIWSTEAVFTSGCCLQSRSVGNGSDGDGERGQPTFAFCSSMINYSNFVIRLKVRLRFWIHINVYKLVE